MWAGCVPLLLFRDSQPEKQCTPETYSDPSIPRTSTNVPVPGSKLEPTQ